MEGVDSAKLQKAKPPDDAVFSHAQDFMTEKYEFNISGSSLAL